MRTEFTEEEQKHLERYFLQGTMFIQRSGDLNCNFNSCNQCCFGGDEYGHSCIVGGCIETQDHNLKLIRYNLPEFFL